MNISRTVKKRWENCHPAGAHLYPVNWHKSEKNMFKRYKRLITDQVDVNNKSILDWGCGGGYLGKYLLSKFKIKKYIAIDIAERSLDRAKEQLQKYRNIEFILTSIDNIKECMVEGESIFISLACIFHFPTKEYFNTFLVNINKSNINIVILEIRDKNKGTIFRKNIYKTHMDANHACLTNEYYVNGYLTNYSLSKIIKGKKGSKTLYYRRVINENT